MNSQVTEIERAAMTLLSLEHDSVENPQLREWVASVMNNPDFAEWSPNGEYDYTADLDTKPEQVRAQMRDKTVRDLGDAVVCYRKEGRPVGDTTTVIDRMTGIGIRSSLAAEVVWYHRSMLNVWATYRHEKDMLAV